MFYVLAVSLQFFTPGSWQIVGDNRSLASATEPQITRQRYRTNVISVKGMRLFILNEMIIECHLLVRVYPGAFSH